MFEYHAKLDTSDPKQQQEYIGCSEYILIIINNSYECQFKVFARKVDKAATDFCLHCCTKRDELGRS